MNGAGLLVGDRVFLTGEGKVLILHNHQAITHRVFVIFSAMHSLFQKAFSVLPM